MIKSAFDMGRKYAATHMSEERVFPERVIFKAMRNNPYISNKARKDFVEGASSWVNQCHRLSNYKNIYG